MNKTIFLVLIGLLFVISCFKEENPEEEYTLGKNYYTTKVDGKEREYYVSVPSGYDPDLSIPAVFMLHGAGGSGESTYNVSGWKELGEEENFLTVFPSALEFCYTNTFGDITTASRWNSLPPVVKFCPGQDLKDDVKFLSQVIEELNERFNLNSKKVYMVGFSSGAQMAFRCAVEISDLITAVVQSAGTHQVDTVFTPSRNLPMTFQLGNKDNRWFHETGFPPLALFDTLLTNAGLFQRIINVHSNSFDYEKTCTLTGDENSALTATFKAKSGTGNKEFKFIFINGLNHSYPNGINFPISGPKHNWEWLKQYSIE